MKEQEYNIPSNHTDSMQHDEEVDRLAKVTRRNFIKITGGVAVAGLLGMLSGCNEKDEIKKSDTTKSDTESTKEPEKTPEVEITVEELEMKAELINDPELLMKTYLQHTEEWFNAGAAQNREAASKIARKKIPDFAQEVANRYDPIFAEALFIKGWEKNGTIVELYNQMKQIHKTTLELYFQTSRPSDKEDIKEPYRRGTECTSIEAVTKNSKSITIRNIEYDFDNTDKNNAEDYTQGGETISQALYSTTRGFSIENNAIKQNYTSSSKPVVK